MKNQDLTKIQSIALDRLISHPDNPNVMSSPTFGRLVRNIEQGGRYEPLVVRPHKTKTDCYEIINGHHRAKALAKLGFEKADAVVWDVDDQQVDILLATLNRLTGSDNLDKKLALLKRLNSRAAAKELAKLLPQTASQIETLVNMELPTAPAELNARDFANPLVFFVSDEQMNDIEKAIESACGKCEENNPDFANMSKAQRRAEAVTFIANRFIEYTQGKNK